MITTQVDIIKRDIRIMMITIDSLVDIITVVKERNENGYDYLKYDKTTDALNNARRDLVIALEHYGTVDG